MALCVQELCVLLKDGSYAALYRFYIGWWVGRSYYVVRDLESGQYFNVLPEEIVAMGNIHELWELKRK